jgi:hypothetical protein
MINTPMPLSSDVVTESSRHAFVALTPLYHFSSDAEKLFLGDKFNLLRYLEPPLLELAAGDILIKHLVLQR